MDFVQCFHGLSVVSRTYVEPDEFRLMQCMSKYVFLINYSIEMCRLKLFVKLVRVCEKFYWVDTSSIHVMRLKALFGSWYKKQRHSLQFSVCLNVNVIRLHWCFIQIELQVNLLLSYSVHVRYLHFIFV